MKRLFAAAGFVSLVTLATAGCNNTCYDCGTCGIAGPTDVDEIHAGGAGVDQDGVAAVRLYLWHKGGCKGTTDDPFFVRYADGKATLAKVSASTSFDKSSVEGSET